jgi:hypothetical protein
MFAMTEFGGEAGRYGIQSMAFSRFPGDNKEIGCWGGRSVLSQTFCSNSILSHPQTISFWKSLLYIGILMYNFV